MNVLYASASPDPALKLRGIRSYAGTVAEVRFEGMEIDPGKSPTNFTALYPGTKPKPKLKTASAEHESFFFLSVPVESM